MNKNLNFNFCKYLLEILNTKVDMIEEEINSQCELSETDQLLRLIYQIGADGFPVGDLAYFVGKKSNPEVQRFILDNLMSDVSSQANPAISGLSDDQITLFTRRSDETIASYCSRLNDSINKDKFIIESAKRTVSSDKDKNQPTQ